MAGIDPYLSDDTVTLCIRRYRLMALTLRSLEIARPAVLTSAAPLESSLAAAVVALGAP